MRRSLTWLLRTILFLAVFFGFETASSFLSGKNFDQPLHKANAAIPLVIKKVQPDSIEVRVGTFLGSESRNYYGDSMGNKLDVVWKTFLGKGTTIVTDKKGVEEWFGAGWTGQPLVVREKEKTFLVQGAFDHHLKKIDAATGEVVWNYEYDDILKGTGTIWLNNNATRPEDRVVILQGSRKGVQFSLAAPHVSSFRAVSFFTGKELWRMEVEHTESYSRDVDASALILRDTAYIGLENGRFVAFDPGKKTEREDTVNRPRIFTKLPLYDEKDHAAHGGNLVTESSPVRLGDHLYITAGSGHVYGFNLATKTIDWDFYIGSDMDGTPVVTADSCLLVEVEKQYIKGHGGVFKLDPRRDPASCVQWYYPTGDFTFSSWEGGVIGSVSVNDEYNDGTFLRLAAFTGIDGNLMVVRYDLTRNDTTVNGPDGTTKFPAPVVQFRSHIGPSISTPVFAQNKLIAAGYNGIKLFTFDAAGNFSQMDSYTGNFEASPVVDRGKVYIASRDGFLYCFGDTAKVPEPVAVAPVNVAPVKKTVPAQPVIAQANPPKPFRLHQAKREAKVSGEISAEERLAFAQKKKEEELAAATEQETKAAPAEKVEKKTTPAAAPVVTAQDKTGNSSPYQLIAGVFRSKENADRNLALWKSRGMSARIILSPKGFFYVSIADGNSQEELAPLMEKVKADYAADSWVLGK